MSEEQKIEQCYQWNWTRFITGLINKRFLAFGTATGMIFYTIQKNINDTVSIILAVGWIIALCFYMLDKAFETAISNAKITAELKAGASISKNGG